MYFFPCFIEGTIAPDGYLVVYRQEVDDGIALHWNYAVAQLKGDIYTASVIIDHPGEVYQFKIGCKVDIETTDSDDYERVKTANCLGKY